MTVGTRIFVWNQQSSFKNLGDYKYAVIVLRVFEKCKIAIRFRSVRAIEIRHKHHVFRPKKYSLIGLSKCRANIHHETNDEHDDDNI